MKSFKEWTLEALEESFSLQRVSNSATPLEALLLVPALTDADLKKHLQSLTTDLKEDEDNWNEEELKMEFIGSLLKLVRFRGPNYRIFYDRPMSAVLGEMELKGTVDAVVATGKQSPKQPFFFLHEYKPEVPKSSGDPKGQLLAAMLAAKTLNKHKDLPIYGCYVLGRFWFFAILTGNTYSFSRAYDASLQEGIEEIFQVLCKIKGKVEAFVA